MKTKYTFLDTVEILEEGFYKGAKGKITNVRIDETKYEVTLSFGKKEYKPWVKVEHLKLVKN